VPNVIRNPYSNTAGNTPASIGNGQLAVNQGDGRIFYRSSAGAVATFSSIASFATTGSFPAVGLGSVLYVAADSSRIYQFAGGVYVEIGVAGGGSSSFTLPNATSLTLGGVVVGTGLSVSSGTVSANVVSVAGRTGTVTISSGDVSGLSAVATSGSAADLSGTLADARLSSAVALHSQLNTTLGQASGVVDAVSRVNCASGVTAGAGQALIAFFTPTATITVSQIAMSNAPAAVAAGLTLARMGIYTYTEGGTATLVARTASDTSLFAANNTTYTRSLDTTGGYPSTYTLNAGTRYGVAYICVGTTQPQLVGRTVFTAVGGVSPRLSGGSATGLSDLPTTFTPNANSQAPFARLS